MINLGEPLYRKIAVFEVTYHGKGVPVPIRALGEKAWHRDEADAIAERDRLNEGILGPKRQRVAAKNAEIERAVKEHEVLVAAGLRSQYASGTHTLDLVDLDTVELTYDDGYYEVEPTTTFVPVGADDKRIGCVVEWDGVRGDHLRTATGRIVLINERHDQAFVETDEADWDVVSLADLRYLPDTRTSAPMVCQQCGLPVVRDSELSRWEHADGNRYKHPLIPVPEGSPGIHYAR